MYMYVKYQGKKIPISERQSILEALESSGVAMNFQCRDGICGTCRCKLLSGQVRYDNSPLATLKDKEVLICVARAKSNLILY